jgi:hypothetical protein
VPGTIPRASIVADSSTATGLAWSAPAGGGSFTKITAGSFTAVTGVNIDSIFDTTYKNYFVLLYNFSATTGSDTLSLQYRYSGTTLTSANYYGSNFNMPRNNSNSANGYTAATSATLLPDIGGSGGYCGIYFSRVGNTNQGAVFYANYFSGENQDVGMSAGVNDANSNTYTGIRLNCASNMTGFYTVYGLEN